MTPIATMLPSTERMAARTEDEERVRLEVVMSRRYEPQGGLHIVPRVHRHPPGG